MDKYNCEMLSNNLCLGCVGLYERDFIGKYKCKNYQELKRKLRDDNKNPIVSKK